MSVLDCEQCSGTGECKPGVRCPCREEDDTAVERRKQIQVARKCFWCGGQPVTCVLCDKTIPCMFCAGSGEFTVEQKLAAHQCEAR
jgi:hypothetical protein